MGISFDDLRERSAARSVKWWGDTEVPLDFVMMELAGEAGEACNAAKKLSRLRHGWPGGKDATDLLIEEIADVVICADLIALRLGVNLGDAVAKKFNKTSEKYGFDERLPEG